MIEKQQIYECTEFACKTKEYVLLIPVLNEGKRIIKELESAYHYHIADYADIVICDGGSEDGSMETDRLKRLRVNTLLLKLNSKGQGMQLRLGIWWALKRGYRGVITIDGNNKDSIEDVPCFIDKIEAGYDFVQGSRFVKGGKAIRTPFIRMASLRFIHAPIISLTAGYRFTDTTNAFRAYSARYLQDDRVKPLRDIFVTYELLAYLSVRASQLGMKVCEIPVTRKYPKGRKVPTKISVLRGNLKLLKILLLNAAGIYNPKD